MVSLVLTTLTIYPSPQCEPATDLAILIDTSLKFHSHIANITRKDGDLSNNILRATVNTVNRDRSYMIPLYTSHIRPILEYCSSLWNLGYIGDLKLLESIQRRWTRSISGLTNLDYADRLRELNLYSVKGRLLRHDLIKIWQIHNNKSSVDSFDLFHFPTYLGTREHPLKIALPRCRLDIAQRFFNYRSLHTYLELFTHCSRLVPQY